MEAHNRIPLRSFHYTPTLQEKLLYSSLNTHISHCLSACLFTDKSIIGVPCHNHCDLGPLSLLTPYRSTTGLLDLLGLCDHLNPSPYTVLQAHTRPYPSRTYKRHSPIPIQVDQGVAPQRQHQAHCTSATVVRKRRSAHLLQHHAIILISQQWLCIFVLIKKKLKIPLLLQGQTVPVLFYRCLAKIIYQIQGRATLCQASLKS